MDIVKIIGIGIIGTFLSVTVKAYRKELGLCTALTTAFLIIAYSLPKLKAVVDEIIAFSDNSGINSLYIKTIIKIIGISYITEFASELSKDADEGLLSKKIQFAGKICILGIMMPIIKGLLTAIISTLADF